MAETCVFSKQSLGPFLCGLPLLDTCELHNRRHSFSRSYGVSLPSSLTRVLSSALEYSSRLPVSVCGTDTCQTRERGLFLEAWNRPLRQLSRSRRRVSGLMATGFAWQPPYTLVRPGTVRRRPPSSIRALAYPSPSPHPQALDRWYGNVDPLSIDYAFRPRLRIRLTLGGLAFPRKP